MEILFFRCPNRIFKHRAKSIARIVLEEPGALKQDAGEYVKTIEIPMHVVNGFYTLTLVSDGYIDGVKVLVVR